MEITRNQVFVTGLILLLLGGELRMMHSFVLTPKTTKLLAEQTKHPVATASNAVEAVTGAEISLPSKAIEPPDWIGWMLLSVGSVFFLHSLTMNKPG